jgi:hypothetical protein
LFEYFATKWNLHTHGKEESLQCCITAVTLRTARILSSRVASRLFRTPSGPYSAVWMRPAPAGVIRQVAIFTGVSCMAPTVTSVL